MKNKSVVFFDATPAWSGGANRILFLAKSLSAEGFYPHIVCSRGGRLGELAERAGIDVFKINPVFDMDPVALCRIFFYLRRISAAVADINSPGFYWIGLAAAKLAGVKTVLTRNVPYRKQGLKRIVNKYLLYGRYDRVISLSAAVKKDLESDYGLSNVRLIYDGIFSAVSPPSPEESAAAKKTFGFAPDDIVFGLVGRLEKNKGQHVAMEAFAAVADACPRAKLLVAGAGDAGYAEYLSSLARKLNLAGRVSLAGYVEDVSLVYKAADILVHPSFYDNIPISIIEALSAGRPVIASRVGGIPEIIADGRNGTLFDAGSVGQLAEKMLNMAAADYAAIGRAASPAVAEKFSAGKMKAEYIELMDELTGGAS